MVGNTCRKPKPFGHSHHLRSIVASQHDLAHGYPFQRSTGWWLTYPAEKYEFVSWDDDIPNAWRNKIHVPNHQPVNDFRWFRFFKASLWGILPIPKWWQNSLHLPHWSGGNHKFLDKAKHTCCLSCLYAICNYKYITIIYHYIPMTPPSISAFKYKYPMQYLGYIPTNYSPYILGMFMKWIVSPLSTCIALEHGPFIDHS